MFAISKEISCEMCFSFEQIGKKQASSLKNRRGHSEHDEEAQVF